MNSCENCRFLRERDDETSVGQCQRFPPQVVVDHLKGSLDGERSDAPGEINLFKKMTDSVWPWVSFDGWCGEHRSRREGL